MRKSELALLALCEAGPALGVWGSLQEHDLSLFWVWFFCALWVWSALAGDRKICRLKDNCGYGREPDHIIKSGSTVTRIWWGRA